MKSPLVLLATLLVSCGAARTRQPERSGYAETLALTVENDLFVGNDDGYSSGVGVTWTSRDVASYAESSTVGRIARLGSFLPAVGDDGYRTFLSMTVAQEIYTPDDITQPVPDPGDQPYAGVLVLQPTWIAKNDRASHSWSLRLGTTGPASGAEETQKAVHDLIGSDRPEGWDGQIPNELFVNVDYTYAGQLASGGDPEHPTWRVVPVGTIGVGTYFTGVGGALFGELGWNLPETLGAANVRRGLNPFSTVEAGARSDFSLSLYAGVGGFAVGHFLPLDGTVWRSSPSVETEPLVGFLTGGLALRFRRLSVGFLFTGLTESFEDQTSSDDFGSLVVAWSL